MSRRKLYGCGCGVTPFHSKVALDEHKRIKHGVRSVPLPNAAPGERPEPHHTKLKVYIRTPEMREATRAASKARWANRSPEARAAWAAAISRGQKARFARQRQGEAGTGKGEKPAPASTGNAPVSPSPLQETTEAPRYAPADPWASFMEGFRALVRFEVEALLGPVLAPPKAIPAPAVQPQVVKVIVPAAPRPEPEPETDRPAMPTALPNLHRNLSLREAILHARNLGFQVRKNSAAEWEFRHPLLPRRVRAGQNRHDCPRALLTMLRQVATGKIPAKPTVGRC